MMPMSDNSGSQQNGQQANQVQLSSTYPLAPMEYVNMYTNENIKAGKAPPPPPIIKDSYTCFGKLIDPNDVLIRSLESQNIHQLYPESTGPINTTHHKRELKKLNHSILIAYLDLLEILVKAPNTQLSLDQQQFDVNGEQLTFKTLREQKLEDIELLFINMHHLINELRPLQARDNIRCILEMQKRQRLETAQKFKTHLFKIVDLLKLCIQSIQPTSNSSSSSSLSLSSTSTSVSIVNNENLTLKSNLFLEDLKNLMSNANQLTKSLDKFDMQMSNASSVGSKFNKKIINLNKSDSQYTTNNTKLSLIDGGGVGGSGGDVDVEMMTIENNEQNDLISPTNRTDESTNYLFNNLNNNKTKRFNNNNNLSKTNQQQQHLNKNCDFKDLILCDIIDDFLLKENEF